MKKILLRAFLSLLYGLLFLFVSALSVYRGNRSYTFTNRTQETISITPLFRPFDFEEYGIGYGEDERRRMVMDTLSYRLFTPYHTNRIYPLRHLSGSSLEVGPGEAIIFFIDEEPIRQISSAMILFIEIKDKAYYKETWFWEVDSLGSVEELNPATPKMVENMQKASRLHLFESFLAYFFLFLFLFFPALFLKSICFWIKSRFAKDSLSQVEENISQVTTLK